MVYFYSLLVAFLWGIQAVTNERLVKTTNPIYAQTITALVCIAFSVFEFGIFYKLSNEPISTKGVFWALASALIAAIALFFYNKALLFGTSSVVVAICSTYPIISMLIMHFGYSEKIGFWQITGSLIAVFGIALTAKT